MESEPRGVPQAASEKNPSWLPEVVDKLTWVVTLTLMGLPYESWLCTVVNAEQAPADNVCGGVAKARFVADPPLRVSA